MTIWLWLSFFVLVGILAALDLVLFTRRPKVVTSFEAAATMALWMLAAVGFSFALGYVYETNWQNIEGLVSAHIQNRNLDGHAAWLQFLTCYVLEIALSLDNIAVLVLLFGFLKIPRPLLGRTLFWGVLLSLVARLMMIMTGAYLMRSWPGFSWVLGGVLVLAMLRVLVLPDERTNFDAAWYVRVLRRVLPVSPRHNGLSLFTTVERNGKDHWAITPMMLAVLIALLLDVTFAADSVPALFSVTLDPFIAFSASAFALLGLRSLFFAVAGVMGRFRYLKLSLVIVLLTVAAKMFVVGYSTPIGYDNTHTLITLAVVSGAIGLGIGLSVLRQRMILHADHAAAMASSVPTPLADLTDAVDITRRNLRKVAILIAGTVVILFGIAIAPLPGPGPMVLVPVGLALLATEFIWARRLLTSLKSGAFSVSDRADAFIDRTHIVLIPIGLMAYWAIAIPLIHAVAHVIGKAFGKDLTPKWYTIAVIAGSPFMPVLLWAWSYVRRWIKARREGRRNVYVPKPAADASAAPVAKPDDRTPVA